MAFTKDPNPANIDANYIYTSTASYTPAALPESGDDGIRYLFIRTKDNVGNLSGWENMFTYVYDTTPPLGVRNESIVEIHGVKSGIPQGKVNHPTFRWTAPDDPRPITYDLYWVEAGEDGCGDPGTTFMHVNEPEVTYEDWPELGMEKAGAKCLLVFAVDEAGNRSEQYATFVFILSETPPILKITDFTSQPEVTSLGKADMFTVNGRKKIIYGKDFVGTITITVSTGTSDDQTVNEGIKSIQFPSLFGDLGETISFDPATYLTDTYSYEYFVPAGATHAGSFNVTLTTENGTKIHAPFDLICESSAPLISDLNLNSGLFASFVVGDILYHGESSYGTLTVSVNATEPEPDANNGYSKVDVVIFPSLASSDTSSDDTSPYSHTWSPITLTGEDDGIYTITAIDNFGNSSFKTFQIISDSTGPDVILDISDAPGMVFIVNWSAHDRDVAPGIPGSGVDHYQARLVPANTSCDSISVIAELDNGSTQKTSVEIADSGVNTPKLCVRAYDRVGNAGAWAEKQPEVVTETAYYPFNGQSVAMSRNGQTYYFGTDHLGSISVTVRQDGTVASEMRYEPYGQVRWIKGTVLSDKSYTGQRSESGFGLMDYNARYYDPSAISE